MSAQVLNEPCGIIQNERVNCARVRSGGLIPSPYTVMSEERWLRDSTLAPALFALISSSFLPSLQNSFVFRCGRTQPGVRTSAPATLHLICSGRSGASRVIKEHVSISVCIPQTLHVWFEWCNLAATGGIKLGIFFPLNEIRVNCACVAEDPVQCGISWEPGTHFTDKGQIVPIYKNTQKHTKNPC